jgi:hypothetical protein
MIPTILPCAMCQVVPIAHFFNKYSNNLLFVIMIFWFQIENILDSLWSSGERLFEVAGRIYKMLVAQ